MSPLVDKESLQREFILNSIKDNFIEIAKAPSRAKMIVHNGDIIISTTRPTRGAISLVNTKLPILIASTGFSVIREVDEWLNKLNWEDKMEPSE